MCKMVTNSQSHKIGVDIKTPEDIQKKAATGLCAHLSYARENEPVTALKECKKTYPKGFPARK